MGDGAKRRLQHRPEVREVLALTLRREPFDMIAKGEKKIEYRENKPFWRSRLIGIRYKEVHFRNTRGVPFMRVEYRGMRTYPKYFAIRLGRILEIKNYKKR